MTLDDLTGRVEQRLAVVEEEILRLQAAADALDGGSIPASGSARARGASSPARRPPTRAPARAAARVPRRSVAGRDRQPGAVVALARELDAGLRNRV